MTLDEFNALAITCAGNIDNLNKQFRAFADLLTKLQKEDPCVKGFDEKLAELDSVGDSLNEFGTGTLNPSYKAVLAAYEELGFFDKRKPYIVEQVNLLTRSIKAVVAENTKLQQGGGRKDLRERYNSCPVLKDPEEKSSDEAKPEEQTNSEGQNQSEDDKGSQTSGAEGGGDELGGAGADATPSNKTSGTTVAGKSNTPQANKLAKPNRRQKNPLGNLSSYTYNISLYMLTPEAYSAFINSGRKNIDALASAAANAGATQPNSGVYLIAQSGGINQSVSQRAPGMKFDYYIDNLVMKNFVAAKETQSASNVSEFKFNIVEPYGFSFLTELKNAKDIVLTKSNLPNVKENASYINALKQFYVLGIRFTGYDHAGTIATTASFPAPSQVNSASKTGSGDSALFERFFDIAITDVNFKLTGKATVYNISASPIPEQVGLTNRFGRINKEIKIQATDVIGALIGPNVGDGKKRNGEIGLLTSLNSQQQAMLNDKNKDIEIPIEYDIKFIGDFDDLKFAGLVLDTDKDKLRSAMTNRKNTSESKSPDISIKAVPNLNTREITFRTDTAILQAISSLIAQSDFLYNAQKVVFDADSSVAEEEKKTGKKTPIRWYNMGVLLEIKGFDRKRQDWAYKITYVIQPYETPFFESPMANKAKPYYGPHKRYDYWYTGKNSEIISYEQTLNNSYFTIALATDPTNSSTPDQTGVPRQPHQRTTQERTGTTGEGREAQNAYLTSLYDPGSWANAVVKILGDPDFLMQTQPGDISQVYDPFYEQDGFTVKANGGQVFIEIDFKEAKDYDLNTGLLNLNESILINPIPKEFKEGPNKVQGVSYQVIEAISSFRGGRFEQELNLIINNFAGMTKKQDQSAIQTANNKPNEQDGSRERAEMAKFARQGSNPLLNTKGLKQAPKSTDSSVAPNTNVSTVTPNTQSTTASSRNPADDDAGP